MALGLRVAVTNSHTYTDPYSYPDANTHTNPNADSDANSDSVQPWPMRSKPDSHVNANAYSNCNSDSDSYPHFSSDCDSYSNADVNDSPLDAKFETREKAHQVGRQLSGTLARGDLRFVRNRAWLDPIQGGLVDLVYCFSAFFLTAWA